MPFTGDLSKLGRLRAVLRELASVPSKVAPGVAARINKRFAIMFASETDPYGKPWAPLADYTIKKKGHARRMWETGETEAKTKARPARGAGILIETTDKAGWNMNPAHNRPERIVLPKYGMPSTWRGDIKAETQEQLNKVKKGSK